VPVVVMFRKGAGNIPDTIKHYVLLAFTTQEHY
jgi:hypothetical protein